MSLKAPIFLLTTCQPNYLNIVTPIQEGTRLLAIFWYASCCNFSASFLTHHSLSTSPVKLTKFSQIQFQHFGLVQRACRTLGCDVNNWHPTTIDQHLSYHPFRWLKVSKMAHPVTECAFLYLKSGVDLEGDTLESQAWQETLTTLSAQNGCQRSYYGRQCMYWRFTIVASQSPRYISELI